MNTVYVITPKVIFDQRFADFQNGTGFYHEVGFSNWGAIRHSLDGTLTLLEETIDKFDPNDLALNGVMTFTHSEVLQYLSDNSENWISDDSN